MPALLSTQEAAVLFPNYCVNQDYLSRQVYFVGVQAFNHRAKVPKLSIYVVNRQKIKK
jgi:hypothetical protein